MTQVPKSRGKLVAGLTIGGAAVALLAVTVVLPSEFGIDPTGAGKALGLTKLAEKPGQAELERGKKRTNVLFAQDAAMTPADFATRLAAVLGPLGKTVPAAPVTDRYVVELPPFQSIELKYVLDEGAPLAFTWTATAPVHVDMHSHPFDGGTELTESYLIEDNVPRQSAVYVAQFSGLHGWYWQNQTLNPVTVTLEATGDIKGSKTFSQGGEADRALVSFEPD